MYKDILLAVIAMAIIAGVIVMQDNGVEETINTRQETIDSLEKEMEAARMQYMNTNQQLAELSDSLDALSARIASQNYKYKLLRQQNEKLLEERTAIVKLFSDSDIQRYLTNRYEQQYNP